MWAGKVWARGDATRTDSRPDHRQQAIADARAMGLDLQLDEVCDIDGLWEVHLPAWRVWCAISGQMRAIALSGNWGARIVWQGLDYGAVPAALDLAGLTTTPDLWNEVRLIEVAAIEELNRVR
jgi:hypothetical protein